MTSPRRVATAPTTALATALATAALVVGVGALPTSAAEGSDRDALVAEVEQELAAEREAILAETVTSAMHDDATFPLGVDDPTFPLDVEGATFPLDADAATTRLDTTREDDGETVLTLTSDLLFEFDESDLTPAASAALAELLEQIPQGADVAVDGHTDSMGTDARNDELSQARAEAVATVLRDERPDLTLTVEGHGSREPVADNTVGGQDNPAGRALNRRVEVTYSG